MNTAEKVTKLLIQKNKTISFMESCTSGLMASMFTDTEGASKVFTGSLVTYSNGQKIKAGVSEEVISRYGVYSSECAREMARTVKLIYNTDIAIGITGTTGNIDSENPGSVTGEAFFCIISGDSLLDFHIQKDVSKMSRKEIKQYYAEKVYEAILTMQNY